MSAIALSKPQPLISVCGLLTLLNEKEQDLRVFALEKINSVIDDYWPEIADYIDKIEAAYEDPTFANRELASLVASRIYFHLEDYSEALHYVLEAGLLFDFTCKSEYTDTIIAICVEEYVKVKREQYEYHKKGQSGIENDKVTINDKLENIVKRILEHCIENKYYMEAIGVTLESRCQSEFESILMNCDTEKKMSLLVYCTKEAQKLIDSKSFRSELYSSLVKGYRSLDSVSLSKVLPQYLECLYHIKDSTVVAETLWELIRDSESETDSWLIACTIAFEMLDYGNRSFLQEILANDALQLKDSSDENGNKSSFTATRIEKLRYILSGDASIDLNLQFLHLNNSPDFGMLDHIKSISDQRSSIAHNAIVMSHAIMQAGTTCDVFLRKNMDWLGRAICWAKFNAAASLGVVHKGNTKHSKKVLSTYLPKENSGDGNGSQYSEGGALYALGLIHSNHYNEEIKEYLLAQLLQTQHSEILQHGACLGLGLLCMGSNDEKICEELKSVLFRDSAVAGEAAAYALGLVMLGSACEKMTCMLLTYARDTQHEKIIRACAIALALVFFRREEEADTLVEQLTLETDHFLRGGAMHVLGMAYCGTSEGKAVRKLLHYSVSDFSDDNRRAAVINLGFVLCNKPDQVPKILRLLCDSYNPHVRQAAGITLGMICCGSASIEAIELLEPMLVDRTEFVRQGAYIGLGFLLMQSTDMLCEKFTALKNQMLKVVSDRHEDITTRFGATIGLGLLDAGGRNVQAQLFSRSGHLMVESVVGMCLFSQYWYWYPLVHLISLSFHPTALVGLNSDLRVPKSFQVKCTGKLAMFDYPAPFTPVKKQEKAKTMTAVLSTAAKRKALKKTDESSQDASALGSHFKKMDISDEVQEDNEKMKDANDFLEISEEKIVVEKTSEKLLSNPTRIMNKQIPYISYLPDVRYTPVMPSQRSGFLLLRDSMPNDTETYLDDKAATKDIADTPEPFEWSG